MDLLTVITIATEYIAMALSAAWDSDAPLAHAVVPLPEVKN